MKKITYPPTCITVEQKRAYRRGLRKQQGRIMAQAELPNAQDILEQVREGTASQEVLERILSMIAGEIQPEPEYIPQPEVLEVDSITPEWLKRVILLNYPQLVERDSSYWFYHPDHQRYVRSSDPLIPDDEIVPYVQAGVIRSNRL